MASFEVTWLVVYDVYLSAGDGTWRTAIVYDDPDELLRDLGPALAAGRHVVLIQPRETTRAAYEAEGPVFAPDVNPLLPEAAP